MRRTVNSIAQLPLIELRRQWVEVWGLQPHRYIRREMLEKSLEFKQQQARGEGLTSGQQKRLDNLIAQYKRNPDHFDQVNMSAIKPGTRLVRVWKGKRYKVIIRAGGYEFEGKVFNSLSQIASDITGTSSARSPKTARFSFGINSNFMTRRRRLKTATAML